jgi:hypothetical protein
LKAGAFDFGPSDGSNTFVYDAESRATSANSGNATYTYDGNGVRVQKAISGGTTTFYVYSGGRVIAEYENGAAVGSPTREYIYSGGQLVAKVEGGATSYYHQDDLTVRLMTNSSGTKIGEQGHYPFGESWYANSTTEMFRRQQFYSPANVVSLARPRATMMKSIEKLEI